MTSAQVVETSVNVISNSPSQDYTHPDNRTLLYDMPPGFKPFTIVGDIGIDCQKNKYLRSQSQTPWLKCLLQFNCYSHIEPA